MIYGIIADVHLRGKDWEDKKVVLTQLAQEFRASHVECILNLGDLFDQGKIGDKYVSVGNIHSWLSKWLTDLGIPMISVEGNHDQTSRESAYDVFHHPLQVVVKNRVQWISVGTDYFICIPWLTANRVGCDARLYVKGLFPAIIREIMAELELLTDEEADLFTLNVLGHLDAVGAQIRSHVSISSEEYSRYAFDLKKLYDPHPSIDNTFLGHIHQRQPINVKGEGYHGYVGYLAPLGFGETCHAGFGWALFDSETRLTEFKQLKAPRYFNQVAPELGQLLESSHKHHFRLSQEEYAIWGSKLTDAGHRVEFISDKLDLETVKNYIQAKDSSFKEVFDQWLFFSGLELGNRELIDSFIDTLNVKWESLTGKLSRIKSVELRNIGPHSHFKSEYADGFTAILGQNGAGKSYLCEAPIFAMFGEWPTDRGNLATFMDKDSQIDVVFEIEGRDYHVRRTLKDMVVYDGQGKALTKELKRSTREFIESLVGDKDNFLQCSFLAQSSQDYNIIECDPSSRMHMLRYFLKLDIFDEYWKEVKDLLSKAKARLELAENKVKEQDSLLEAVNDVENSLSKLANESATLTSEIEFLKALIEEHLEGYEAQNQHAIASALKQNWENDLAREEKKLVDRQIVLDNYQEPMIPNNIPAIEYAIETLREEVKKEEALANRYKSLKVVMNGSSLESAGCAPNHFKCPLIDKYVETQKSLNELPSIEVTYSSLSDLNTQLRGFQESLNTARELKAKRSEAQSLVDLSHRRIESLTKDIANINQELLELNFTPTEVNVGQLMSKQEAANKKLIYNSRAQGAEQASLTHYKKQVAEVELIKESLADLKYQVDSYQVLEKAFNKNGIAHYLASSALPELQEIFNSLIEVSFDDRLQIVFDNVAEKSKKIKESFSILKVNSRRSHDVRHCSGGERAVLQLLWKLTLLIYQARRNEGYKCLTLDEPTAALDAGNVESTIKLLQYVAKSFSQIFLITHDEELASMADQQIIIG